MTNPPITSIFSPPRPVTLGGRTFLVGEVRLSDVVSLQDWLERGSPCPLDAIRSQLPAMEPAAKRIALEAAWEAAETGPPIWGDERSDRMFNSGAGIVKMFSVILTVHQPFLTQEEIEEIAETSSPEEYLAMRRAWRRMGAIEEIEWLLGMAPASAGGEVTWPQAVVEVAEATGWTLDYIMSLTFSQFRYMRNGGKSYVPGGIVVASPKGRLKQMLADFKSAKKKLFG